MEVLTKNGKEFLVLKVGDDEVLDFQCLICAGSGYGKTLALESLIYHMYHLGYLIIILNDAKNLTELGFFQFKEDIMKSYHKNALKQAGISPTSLPVRIYHPFSFGLPKYKIPEMEIVTIPIKDIGAEEFLFLLESEDDKTNLDILQNSQSKLLSSEGWYEFAERVNKEVTKQTEKFGKTEITLRSPESFGFKSVAAGNVRNIGSLYNTFYQFRKNYFLQSEEYPLNIDWRQFFENQKEIKFISTKYLNNEKIANFFQLYITNSVVRKKKLCPHKIFMVIDEIKDLCPNSDKRGFKQVLSAQLSRNLNTSFRSNGISSASSSQSLSAIDKTLIASNVFTVSLIGNIQGIKDAEILRDIYHFEKEHLKIIQNLKRNKFTTVGLQESRDNMFYGAFTNIPSPTPHCEPTYRFDDIFSRQFPERMTNYSQLIKQIKDEVKIKEKEMEEENEMIISELQEQQQKKQEKKEQREQIHIIKEETKEQKKFRKQEETKRRALEIYRKHENGLSTPKLGKEYNLSQSMIMKILKQVKEKWMKKQDSSESTNEN